VSTELVEAEVVENPGNLFGASDPALVLERATKAADALKSVIQQRGLFTLISGKAHVRVEGWQTLGAMLGVTPVCTWTRPLENGWEARVEAHTLDGRVVGAAEAMCTRSERMWAKRDDYALRSMAQTRATSKALSAPLRFVITLAGYEGTPAEEMTVDERKPPLNDLHTLGSLIETNDLTPDQTEGVKSWIKDQDGIREDRVRKAVELLTEGKVDALFAGMKAHK
jgi:hypothetical protein